VTDWTGFPAFFSFSTVPAHTFCTTRRFGVSVAEFRAGNLSFSVGDNPAAVVDNRKLFAALLAIDVDQFSFLRQIHGSRIVSIKSSAPGRWSMPSLDEGDAMISAGEGIALAVLLADCVGVVIHSPQQRVSAVCHSGWRGTAENICGNVVDTLRTQWGCSSEELYAGISPAICGRCYTVGGAVAALFARGYPRAVQRDAGKYFLDLPAIVKAQMRAAGMRDDHIEACGLCTCENTHLWYSHREEGTTGRFMVGIVN